MECNVVNAFVVPSSLKFVRRMNKYFIYDFTSSSCDKVVNSDVSVQVELVSESVSDSNDLPRRGGMILICYISRMDIDVLKDCVEIAGISTLLASENMRGSKVGLIVLALCGQNHNLPQRPLGTVYRCIGNSIHFRKSDLGCRVLRGLLEGRVMLKHNLLIQTKMNRVSVPRYQIYPIYLFQTWYKFYLLPESLVNHCLRKLNLLMANPSSIIPRQK